MFYTDIQDIFLVCSVKILCVCKAVLLCRLCWCWSTSVTCFCSNSSFKLKIVHLPKEVAKQPSKQTKNSKREVLIFFNYFFFIFNFIQKIGYSIIHLPVCGNGLITMGKLISNPYPYSLPVHCKLNQVNDSLLKQTLQLELSVFRKNKSSSSSL